MTHVERESPVFYDVAQNGVVNVTPGRHEVSLGRGEGNLLVMYFIVAALLAVKLSEVVSDLCRRAKLVPHHYDVTHLESDVRCIVVALPK